MKRRTFIIWMSLGTLGTSGLWLISNASQGEENLSRSKFFYISPNGNDNWSGTLKEPNVQRTDGPLKTLEKARDTIRQLKTQDGGTLQQPVTVFLRGGTYFLSQPLDLTPEDSGTEKAPITYCAYPNETPIISGGELIKNWEQQGELKVANLPDVREGKWYFRSMRVANKWAIRARYPKFNPTQPLTDGWLYAKASQGEFGVGFKSKNSGNALSWLFNIKQSDTYSVWLRYFSRNRPKFVPNITLQVDDQSPLNINDLSPTKFEAFQWQKVGQLENLTTGKHHLTWTHGEKQGFTMITLDSIALTNDSNWNPNTDSFENITLLHAETFTEAKGDNLERYPRKKGLSEWITVTDPNEFPNWSDESWQGAEAHVFMGECWHNSVLPVLESDVANQSIRLGLPQDKPERFSRQIAPGNRFFIENVREALTDENEWYLDRNAGKLFYKPPQVLNVEETEIVAPRMTQLLRIQGKENYVEHLFLEGLTFTDTDWTPNDLQRYRYGGGQKSSIELSHTRHITIKDCTFTHLGGRTVGITDNSDNIQIISNNITHLGQAGIGINASSNNLVVNNYISNCGLIYKHVAGVGMGRNCRNNRVAHNHIEKMPRFGITTGGEKNIVEFNELFDTMRETSDGGAFYTFRGGRKAQRQTNDQIQFNFIRNVTGMKTTVGGKLLTPYHSYGIYLDGYASHTTVFGNLIQEAFLAAINLHGGRSNRVENNFLLNCPERQFQIRPISNGDPLYMEDNIFRHNIVVYQTPKSPLFYCPSSVWRKEILKECDFNLYWEERKTNLSQIKTPVGNFNEWRKMGFDRNSLITDPLFMDQEQETYQLSSQSPAWELGIKSIPIGTIGIKGFDQ